VVGTAVVVVVIAAGLGWAWRRGSFLVGTDNDAGFRITTCFNSVTWRAPDGSEWVVEKDARPVGAWESEPRRLKGTASTASAVGQGAVWRQTAGTMHIDDLDHATFTSRAGGTLAFRRVTGDAMTTECRGAPGDPLPMATAPYAVAFNGVLAQGDPASRDGAVLMDGTVRASVDGQVVAEAPAVNGLYAIYVPALGAITLTGDVGSGACASHSITITSGVPDTVNLVCP
jgi:hypothetical protein